MVDSVDIFAGVAVSSTTAYASRVTFSLKRHFYVASSTSTAAGTLKRQVNNLGDVAYADALAVVAAANPSYTPAQVEAANTTGWCDQSFLQSDVTNSGATIALAAAATFSANMPGAPRRTRLIYTNSSGTGTVSVWLQLS